MGAYIVIPAFNEESQIAGVIKGLKKHGYKNIIVVDDGSYDNTYSVSKKQKVTVLRHIINRGQGAALKTGIDYALKKGATSIVTFDSDGQHVPEDVKKLLNALTQGYDVALGSRFIKKNNVPLSKRIVLPIGAFIIWMMYGIRLSDSHNGLRALSRNAAQKIKLTTDGMEHASEFVEEISRNRLKYVEVPVTVKYTEYSKAHASHGITNAPRIFFKMLIKRFMK